MYAIRSYYDDEQALALQQALYDKGLKHSFVCNDGYLGVMAGIENGVGVCYSAGSGVTCIGSYNFV